MLPIDDEEEPVIIFEKAGVFTDGRGFELRLLFRITDLDGSEEHQEWVRPLSSKTLEEARIEAAAEMIGLGIPVSLDDFQEE